VEKEIVRKLEALPPLSREDLRQLVEGRITPVVAQVSALFSEWLKLRRCCA
jgi:hypothetical protein